MRAVDKPGRQLADSVRALVPGLGSLVLLLGLIVGVPLALSALAGWPLPRTVPRPEVLRGFLDEPHVPQQFFVAVLALAGWVGWGTVMAVFVIELHSLRRGRLVPVSTLFEGLQQLLRACLRECVDLVHVGGSVKPAEPETPGLRRQIQMLEGHATLRS